MNAVMGAGLCRLRCLPFSNEVIQNAALSGMLLECSTAQDFLRSLHDASQ